MTLNPRLLEEYLSAYPLSVHIFPQVASTNTTAWEILSRAHDPILVIAEAQSEGRGQWGRQWQSPKGGLYLSLAFDTALSNPANYPLVFASGWGIATALRNKGLPVALKWPNDLMLEGRKLGGIKIESRGVYIVVGVGINWLNPVPGTGINLASYESLLSLEELAALTTLGILDGYDYYRRQGIEELLKVYTDLWINDRQKVIINGHEGTIIGVTQEGNLRVKLHSENASTVMTCPPGAVSLGYDQDRD
ncbi:MAG: Bifunctional ligase/repressor BirA [Chroococcopsis gigantea SAG 12.99]|nr:Bifunctional ligase/repressor BirA [Chroococcopsis gigantea SAG 12.99]